MEVIADYAANLTPAQLHEFAARLDPDDLAVLEEALGRRFALGWRAHPAAMMRHLQPGTFETFKYTELLSRKFVQLDDGSDPFQIWNLPAQYGKSLYAQWG